MTKLLANRNGVELQLDANAPLMVAFASSDAQSIPGIDVTPIGLKLPRNVWGLPEALALFQAVGEEPEPYGLPAAPLFALEARSDIRLALMPHQQAAVDFAFAHGGSILLADEIGLGKTRSAIAIAEGRRVDDSTRRTLIIAPRMLRASWINELHACGFPAPQVLIGTDFTTVDTDAVVNPWWFIHDEVLDAWMGRLHRYRFDTVIIDEAHRYRSAAARRTQAGMAIAGQAAACVLLTGTPVVNRPGDLWPLLSMVTGKGTWGSRTQFRQRYSGAIHNGYGFEDIGPTHEQELQARMATCYLRREFSDTAVKLPPFTRSIVEAVLDNVMLAEHNNVLDLKDEAAVRNLVSALVNGQIKHNVLATLTKLRGITARGKLKTTTEYVQSLVEQNESVVVFVHERATAHALWAKLSAVKDQTALIYRATGDDEQTTRDEIVRRFQLGGGVLIATYGALGVGVTLHKARLVVLHDLPWTFAELLQAEGRVHRVGQDRPTHANWIIAAGTVDRILARVLQKKAEVHAGVGIGDARAALAETGLTSAAVDDEELTEWMALAGSGDW